MIIQHLFKAVAGLRKQIHIAPFNVELAKGTLPKHIFMKYVMQDALYLADYAKALELVGNRLTNERHVREFRRFTEETLAFESELHAKYLRAQPKPGLFNFTRTAINKIPIIDSYTKHLLLHAEHSDIAVAISALAACFEFYYDLGATMAVNPDCHQGNPYHSWITTYSDPYFKASHQSFMSILREVSNNITCPRQIERMTLAFYESAYFELLFCERVYDEKDVTLDFYCNYLFRQ